MDLFFSVDAFLLLTTLTFLEIVLGVDNIVFISILANKLPPSQRSKTAIIGLFFAMLQRIVLLFFVTSLMKLNEPFLSINLSWLQLEINGQSMILLAGGIFLLYKSIGEIFEKVDKNKKSPKVNGFCKAIIQILLIDFVFSIDSILTAVGMTSSADMDHNTKLGVMVTAVALSIIIMGSLINKIRRFINRYPSIQVLGLAFLILIGFMLIAESAQSSHTEIFGNKIKHIPKGYIYFAIVFSLFVELLNIKSKRDQSSKE